MVSKSDRHDPAPADEHLSDEDREGEIGWRLVKWLVGAVLLLVAGLILESLGVPGAAAGALAGLVLLMVVVYGGPLLVRLWRGTPR